MADIKFTPTFFTRPAASPPASTPIASSVGRVASRSEQKSYSPRHGVPQYVSPIKRVSPLSDAHQRYADIDWTNQESIMQDGSRVKFGAPR
ncbi:hypothetical protein FWH58_01770 [Candidatus Saccharibacteria bacterium]|nr:hypothetical protein [Candidatus Saccharibacteria bacterium]